MARPRASGGVESAISASRGAVRIPLPIRSPTRATSTSGQAVATMYSALAATDAPYPVPTSNVRRPIRSDRTPEPSFTNAATLSATPSTIPMTDGVAASTLARKSGTT